MKSNNNPTFFLDDEELKPYFQQPKTIKYASNYKELARPKESKVDKEFLKKFDITNYNQGLMFENKEYVLKCISLLDNKSTTVSLRNKSNDQILTKSKFEEILKSINYEQKKLIITNMEEGLGHGVFTSEYIVEGSPVAMYSGIATVYQDTEKFDSNPVNIYEDEEEMEQVIDRSNSYNIVCSFPGVKWVIDAQKYGCISRFFQHAPDREDTRFYNFHKHKDRVGFANLNATTYIYHGFPIYIFHAGKDGIEENSQLTFNYGIEYWQKFNTAPSLFCKTIEANTLIFKQKNYEIKEIVITFSVFHNFKNVKTKEAVKNAWINQQFKKQGFFVLKSEKFPDYEFAFTKEDFKKVFSNNKFFISTKPSFFIDLKTKQRLQSLPAFEPQSPINNKNTLELNLKSMHEKLYQYSMKFGLDLLNEEKWIPDSYFDLLATPMKRPPKK